MELEMHPHRWERRWPDWPAAVAAGLVAGAVLMVLELLWVTTVAGDPWHTTRLVAAMVMGTEVLQAEGFAPGVVIVALITHYVLGVVFGVGLAILFAGFQYESAAGMMEVLGAVAGVLLYFLNFHGLSLLFPWIAEMRSWATLIAHMVFGMTVAFTYWKLERPSLR